MTESLVHFVVAVDAEAKPLISWFGLRRQQPDRGFPVFRHAHIALVVSGPGKANAAAATAHLHAVCGYPRDALWINLGTAGHADHSEGSCFVAQAIDEAASNRSWYPPLAVTPPWPGARVRTLDRPDLEYVQDALLEMEASGFYATACRFSTAELVQVIKVVSDNRERPANRLSAADLTALVGRQLDALDLFLHRLGRLANELEEDSLSTDEQAEPFVERWHFTASQRQQLAAQLHRWLVHQPDAAPWPAGIEDVKSASEAIAHLASFIDHQPFRPR